MANEFIEFLSDSALSELKKANAELVTMVANVDNVGKKMKNISTPSGSDSAIKSLTEQYKQQEAVIVKLQTQIQKLVEKKNVENNAIAKTMRALENETKSRQALDAQRQKALTALDKEAAKLKASENIYNKIQSKMNLLSAEYKNLAARRELGIVLTDKEAKRYDFLQSKIQTYDKTLKAVDATMGKYQRNVGNYASAFNPLSNSINQLTREMPAFTYSVQTGFMALSNNIPIFTDAIGNAIAQNKLLQAEGKPTKSVLSQLAGAFLSWQTLMGVGITLLTVYGKEIGEFIKGLFDTSKGLQDIESQINQLNASRREASELASKEISELERLYKVSQDVTLSITDRKKAVDKLQELYPNYLANIKDENILNGNAEKQYYKLRDAIIAKYTAQAIGDKLAENSRERLDKLLDIQQKIEDTEKEIIRLRKTGNDLVIKGSAQEKTQTIRVSNNDLIIAQEKLLLKLQGDLLAFNKSAMNEDSILIKTQQKLLNQSSLLNIEKKEEIKTTKKKTKAKKDELEVDKELEQVNLSSLNALQKTISALKSAYENATIGSVQYGLLGNQIKLLETIYEGLTKAVESSNEAIGEGIELNLGGSEFITDEDGDKLKEEGDKLRELLKNFKESFIDDFADQSGFGKTLDLLSGGLKQFEGDAVATALAITDAFQEAFNTITEMSNQRFQAQYDNLAKEKEVALMFAGESASARAEIDRQYEQKQREIRKREFKAQKQQALFNIAINTAQAIISTYAQVPKFDFGVSATTLALIIGGIGAVQAGVVAAQKVPEFWKGTDNAPEGLALTQERGREIITDSRGNIKSLGSDKGAELTYLNKGDKVFNADKTMEMLMFDNSLNNMLNNSGISMPNIEVNTPKIDLQPVIDAINKKDGFVFNYDQNGARVSRVTENQTIEYANRRAQGIGKIF
jgi:hypothetical protein